MQEQHEPDDYGSRPASTETEPAGHGEALEAFKAKRAGKPQPYKEAMGGSQ
jgi:hypothetical protein